MSNGSEAVKETYGLLLFEATGQALKAEQELKAADVACAVIPTPLEFSSGCGIALLIEDEQVAGATAALEGCTGHELKYPYVRSRTAPGRPGEAEEESGE